MSDLTATLAVFSAVLPAVVLAVLLPSGTLAGEGSAEWIMAPQRDPHQALVTALGDELAQPPRPVHHDALRAGTAEVSADDLLLAVGTEALKDALALEPRPRILALMVPRLILEELAGEVPVAAVYFDQPESRQLLLISELSADTRRVATVLGPASRRRQAALEAAVSGTELRLETATVSSRSEVIAALDAVLSRADIFLALPDPVVHNRASVRNILLATYRRKVPTVAFSASYVRAGAVAGIYSGPEDLAVDAARLVRAYREGRWTEDLPRVYPERFRVDINRRVARSLGLHPPEDTELVRRIREREAEDDPRMEAPP